MIWIAIPWLLAGILAIFLTLTALALRAERDKTSAIIGELMHAANEAARARGAILRLQRIQSRYSERRMSDVN
jgi:hypothetical protein